MFTLGDVPTLLAARKPQAHFLIQAVARGMPADRAELLILGHVEEMLRKYLRMVTIEDTHKKEKGAAFDSLLSFVAALVKGIGYPDMVLELVFVEALLKPLDCDLDQLVQALEKADEDATENVGPILKPYVTWPIGKRIVELAGEALEFRETEREVREHVEQTRNILNVGHIDLLKLKECVVFMNHATLKARSASSLPQKLRDDLHSLEEEVQHKVLTVLVSPLGAALSVAVAKTVEGDHTVLPSMHLPKDEPCELTLFDFSRSRAFATTPHQSKHWQSAQTLIKHRCSRSCPLLLRCWRGGVWGGARTEVEGPSLETVGWACEGQLQELVMFGEGFARQHHKWPAVARGPHPMDL
jgi:hypothetical protein